MEEKKIQDRVCQVESIAKQAPRATTPPGLKTELLEYQKASLHRILSLEASRKTTPKGYLLGNPRDVHAPCCILAEPFGSGKTIIILAVLLSRPVIPRREMPCNHLLGDLSRRRFSSFEDRFEDLSENAKKYQSEVIKEIGKVIFPSIIIVAPSVLNQWKETIEELTDLEYFVIGNVRDLRDFYCKFKQNEAFVNRYDIILIKNGTISAEPPINWDCRNEKNSVQNSIPRIVSKILEGVVCNWLIYDDYDVVALPSSHKINSLYTIFVSATQNYFSIVGNPETLFESIEDLLDSEYSDINLGKMYKDSFVNSLIVRSDNSFIESCFSLPKIIVFRSVHKNKDEKYLKLFKYFRENNSNGFLEAINGEAINSAIKLLEIEVEPTMSSIFKKILYREWDVYEQQCILLEILKEIEKVAKGLPSRSIPHTHEELTSFEHSLRDLAKETQRRNQGEIEKKTDMKRVYPEYQSENLFETIEEMKKEAKETRESSKKTLERVKGNLSEGDCPICCSELDSLAITQCCHLVVCKECLIRAFLMRREASSNRIVGMCPQCRSKVDLERNIIHINGEKGIKEIMANKEIDIKLVQGIAKEAQEEPREEISEINPKLRVLYDIIHSRLPERTEKINYCFDHVMFGIKDCPAPTPQKKLLIFASFEESLDVLSSFLREHNVNFLRLGGDYQKKALIIEKFREETQDVCMLINSDFDCSGIHLPETTDIVFFHNIFNRHVRDQIVGRAQRIGRKYNLNVWFLLYNNEVA